MAHVRAMSSPERVGKVLRPLICLCAILTSSCSAISRPRPAASNCVSWAAVEIAQKEAGIAGLPPAILRTPTPLGYQWVTRCGSAQGVYVVDLRTDNGIGWTWRVNIATREAEMFAAGNSDTTKLDFGRVGPIWLGEPRPAILKELGADANQQPACKGIGPDAYCIPALSYSDGHNSLRIIFSGSSRPIARQIAIRNRNDIGPSGKFKQGVPPLADWQWMGYSVFKTQYGPLSPDIWNEQFTDHYSATDPSGKINAGLDSWEGGILQFTLNKLSG